MHWTRIKVPGSKLAIHAKFSYYAFSLCLLAISYSHSVLGIKISQPGPTFPCSAPLPILPGIDFDKDRPEFQEPLQVLETVLANATASPAVNSLVIAIVTPSGIIFEKGYGVARVNETAGTTPDSNTIYRLGSVSKMFATLETLILRDKGALDWDDPVDKFIPNFTYPSTGWKEHYDGTESFDDRDPMTLRQLSSHLAGLVRNPGPVDIPTWPNTTGYTPHFDFPSKQEILERIATHPLALPPYTFPAYSNTAFSVLGFCVLAANSRHASLTKSTTKQPTTYAELLARDVFGPLGMKDSFFSLPDVEHAGRMAVSVLPSEADMTFGDEQDAAGGQYGTINDLAIFMRTLLDPSQPKKVLRASTIREWLRPLHGWYDQFTEVGAPWEITKWLDSYGRPQRFYQKSGALFSYQSLFSFNPSSSFGVIALATGTSGAVSTAVENAIGLFQPAFDSILEAEVKKVYAGTWKSDDGLYRVTLDVQDGSLWATEFVWSGADLLQLLQATRNGKPALPLWWTGRQGEFRIILVSVDALPPAAGCTAFWGGISPANSRDAPVDLFYFSGGDPSGAGSVLHIPSMGLSLPRS